MKGTIKTYLPEKSYGFIKGDDGKDYYFHKSEFHQPGEVDALCEEAVVEFEQAATPKGYKAKNCMVLKASTILTHVVPDEFMTSRTDTVKGWEVIERGKWVVHGSSRVSPDAAKQEAIDAAQSVGANGLIHFEYYKTTGSEAGTGRGTHHFTIHNFRGRIATLGKRSARGKYKLEELAGMNDRASAIKRELAEKSAASRQKRNAIWFAVLVASAVCVLVFPWLVIAPVLLGFTFGRARDYDSWLKRA